MTHETHREWAKVVAQWVGWAAAALLVACLMAPRDLVSLRGSRLKGLVGSYQMQPILKGTLAGSPCAARPIVGPTAVNLGGSSAGDPVDTSVGAEFYSPGPDLTAYSACSVPVSFQREYSSAMATVGYGSDGLAAGWVHNYDFAIVVMPCSGEGLPSCTTPFDQVMLLNPDGGWDILTPTSQPTMMPSSLSYFGRGAPFTAAGVPGATVNTWKSFTLNRADGSVWTFQSIVNDSMGTHVGIIGSNVLLLTSITPQIGHSITLNRDLTQLGIYPITSLSSSGTTLLNLTYEYTHPGLSCVSTTVPLLQTVSDPQTNRTVKYTFACDQSVRMDYSFGPELASVSKINSVLGDPAQYSYTYIPLKAGTGNSAASTFYLTGITTLDYTGHSSGHSTTIQYGCAMAGPPITYVPCAAPPLTTGESPRVTKITDGNGNTTSFNYDYVPPAGLTIKYPACHYTKVDIADSTGANFRSWIEKFDINCRPLGRIDFLTNFTNPNLPPDAAHTSESSVSYGDYTGDLNPDKPNKIIDPLGRTIHLLYDTTSLPTGQNVGYGNLKEVWYQPQGGNVVKTAYTYTYPNLSAPWPSLQVPNPNAPQVCPSSRPCGALIGIEDEIQNPQGTTINALTPTCFAYYPDGDANSRDGLLQSVIQPKPGDMTGNTVATSFDYTSVIRDYASALRQIKSVTSPGPTPGSTVTTTYSYLQGPTPVEKMGEPVQATISGSPGSGSETASFGYDALGDLNQTTDALGNTTTLAYNPARQPLTLTLQPTGQTGPGSTTIAYNYGYVDGPLTSVTLKDESGSPTQEIDYSMFGGENEPGMVTRWSPALGMAGGSETATTTYTPTYAPLTLTNGNAATTRFSYANGNGRLMAVQYPLKSGPYADQVQYAYAQDGQLASVTDGFGPVGSMMLPTQSFSYDANTGLPTGVTNNRDPASSVTLSYDAFNRPMTVANSHATTQYTLDQNGYPTAVSTSYPGGPPAQAVTYGYGPDGSRSTMHIPGVTMPFMYGYDGIGRLSSETNALGEISSWSYDTAGRLTLRRQLTPGTRTNYGYMTTRDWVNSQSDYGPGSSLLTQWQVPASGGYDAQGRLKQVSTTGVYANGMNAYSYDGAGRMTQESNGRKGAVWNQAYDNDGNLTAFQDMGSSPYLQALFYNADDQVVCDWTYDQNGNPTLYKGYNLSFDGEDRMTAYGGQMSASYGPDGLRASKTVGSDTTYFVYDGDRAVEELYPSGAVKSVNTYGADGLVSRWTYVTGGESTYYEFDRQGNVAYRLDGAGSITSEDLYDAWGNRLAGGQAGDPFGYGAQYGSATDAETGLVLMGHRYYDPAWGRFVNRDPIGNAGGQNLYNYAGSDPINHADPSGLDDGDPADIYIPGSEGEAYVGYFNQGLQDLLPRLPSVQPGSPARQAASGGADMLPVVGDLKLICELWGGRDPVSGLNLSPLDKVIAAGAVALSVFSGFDPGPEEVAARGAVHGLEDLAAGICFAPGTRVQMADGSAKPIEQVQPGDWVMSRDPRTGRTEARQVLRVFKHTAHETSTARMVDTQTGATETITATPQHPFFTPGGVAVALDELGIGTQVVTRAGPSLTLLYNGRESHPAGIPVYNLEVQGDHTYFVGDADGGVWVHNACRKLPNVRVIGRLDDSARFAHWPYHEVLNVPEWSIAANDAWIQRGIDEAATFRLASPIKFNTLRSHNPRYPFTVYFRELKQLRSAGYGRVGDFLMPPGRW